MPTIWDRMPKMIIAVKPLGFAAVLEHSEIIHAVAESYGSDRSLQAFMPRPKPKGS